MSDALPILQSFKSTSSGTGVSYYTTAARCPKKAALDKQFSELRNAAEDTSAADAGTIFHALMAIWYEKQQHALVELDDMNMSGPADYAKFLFENYTKHFKPDEWGKVLGAEMQYPRNDFDKALMEDSIGVSPFTMRLDLVVKMTEADVEKVETARPGLVLNGPGVYIVDHKTSGQKDTNDAIKYIHETQGNAYQMAYNAVHPLAQCKGFIYNKIIGHKKMERFDAKGVTHSFQTFFCPPPNEIKQQAVRNFMKFASEQAKTKVANHTACFDFHKPCGYLMNGLCDRT